MYSLRVRRLSLWPERRKPADPSPYAAPTHGIRGHCHHAHGTEKEDVLFPLAAREPKATRTEPIACRQGFLPGKQSSELPSASQGEVPLQMPPEFVIPHGQPSTTVRPNQRNLREHQCAQFASGPSRSPPVPSRSQ